MLPQAKHWQRFFASVYWIGHRFGTLAAARFLLGLPVTAYQVLGAQNVLRLKPHTRRKQQMRRAEKRWSAAGRTDWDS